MIEVIVIGTGGLAREFSSYFSENSRQIKIVGFSSTNHQEHDSFSLPGKLFKGEITPELVGTDQAVIAIGSPSSKKKISEKLKTLGFRFPSLIHSNCVVSERAKIEEGVIISPNCTVSPNAELKSFCYLNFGVGVGHDAIVGKFVQINPGTQLGGFSKIGNETIVGSGSTILQGIQIGSMATIASGSVVLSRVAEGATMLGNPAKRMRAFEKIQ